MATRKSKATVAAIALAAVAATGSTLALWDDDASVAAATISSGHLGITAGTRTAADISPDDQNGATNESIDLASFKAVPGDTLRIAQQLSVDLEGQNIAARLSIATAAGSSLTNVVGTEFAGKLSVDSVQLYDGAVEAIDTLGTAVTPTSGGVYSFDGPTTGAHVYTVVYQVTFDVDTPDKVAQDASATLAGSTATLVQVRPADLP